MQNYRDLTRDKLLGTFKRERRPLIEEGEYICVITKWEHQFMFGRMKLMLNCILIEKNVALTYICALPLDEFGEVKYPSRRSKFYKLISALFSSDQEQFDLNDLIDKRCIAVVKTSTTDEHRKLKPISEHYSIITELTIDTKNYDDEYDF